MKRKNPPGCKVSDVGRIPGAEVKAITDGAGPNVVIIGDGIHILSPQFTNHNAAVRAAQKVVDDQNTSSCEGWYDLITEQGGIDAFMMVLDGALSLGRAQREHAARNN